MNILLSSIGTGEGILLIALIIVGILLAIACFVASIVEIVLYFKYHKLNRVKTKAGFTAYAAARTLLDLSGMGDVQIKPLGFFRALAYGDYYDKKTKTIYLRKRIINQSSIMGVGLAIQKIGLAVMDRENDKKFLARAKIQPLVVLAPILFIPLVLIGTLIDLMIANGSGILTVVGVVLAVVLYGISFVFTLLSIPVEKKANAKALEIMTQTNFLDAEEREKINSVFKFYIANYVIQFIIAVLKAIQFILKLLLKIVASQKN